MNAEPIKMRVTSHFTLVLDAEDGTEPKTWKLAYTYKAIAKVEEAIGKDIKKIADWQSLSSGKEFPVIVWGGLDRFNPEVTLDEVRDILNPECQRLLSDAIFELMFPGVREAYEKHLAEIEAEAKAKDAGATADPNVSAVPTTA
jgi:hypothetical protein